MKKILNILSLLSSVIILAQTSDSTSVLKEVTVKAYFSKQPLLKIPASVSLLSQATFEQQSPFSLVSAVNTVPGVRMEERSPGSYRLSIRGSLLRSPFGVRNVKIYINDFVLTDASGNSYFNLLDAGSVTSMEIIKGPEGSIYGANTGGVVLINSAPQEKNDVADVSFTGGSYGMFHQNLSFASTLKNFSIKGYQSYYKSDGYREQSEMERKYFHLMPEWKISSRDILKSFILYSDLGYETPGGLTLAQFQENPKAARSQALTQQARVSNQTFFGGVSNTFDISKTWKHVIALSVSKTDFRNFAIANYEARDEHSLGLRTYLEYTPSTLPFSFQTGWEGQQTYLNRNNYKNNAGVVGNQQSGNDYIASNNFGFFRVSINPISSLSLETAVSINQLKYSYQTNYPVATEINQRKFGVEVMPRIGVSWAFIKNGSLRSSISKGFSPPTLEEVNPSGTDINTLIDAEQGWNKEIGYRFYLLKRKMYIDGVYFDYDLKKAIVRGTNANGIDYYVNAGSTKQRGFESELFLDLPFKKEGILKGFQIKNSTSIYHFRFEDYTSGVNDYSGNKLTGVPSSSIVSSLLTLLPFNCSLFLQHTYTSSLPLNDANSAFTEPYHLFGGKIQSSLPIGKYSLRMYSGVDNLTNEKYSLGNDINAAGNRFYNAAPGRNYYFGVSVKL